MGSRKTKGQGDAPHGAAGGPPSFVVVDFFCGAGGTTAGLIDAGCHVLAGVDKDARCGPTYEANNVNRTGERATYLHKDIFARSDEHPAGQQHEIVEALRPLVDGARARWPGVPLLFAICAPCQPFTSLSRKALSEDRALARVRDRSLLLETLKLVDAFRPDAILSENVSGIDDPKYGGVWSAFAGALRSRGFSLGIRRVDASRFGVPQTRHRCILAAARLGDGAGPELDLPSSDGSGTVVTVGAALAHLAPLRAGGTDATDPNHRAAALSDINLRRIARARPGESNLSLTSEGEDDLTLDCHRRARAKGKRTSFPHVYTRMDPSLPAPTLTTKFHSISNGRFGHFDMGQDRAISVREGAILQSFRDDYLFIGDNIGTLSRMVGNAVPPRLARFFGAWLAEALAAGGDGPAARGTGQMSLDLAA